MGKDVYISKSSTFVGEVILGDDCNIWYSAVLRGDVNKIVIGKGVNIQDGSIVHVGYDLITEIGDYVSVGHAVCLHGCKIGNGSLIGNGAIVLDGVTVGERSIVAAGSVLPPHKSYPGGVMIMGSPAKVTRELTDKELAMLEENWQHYVAAKNIYLEKGL